MDNIPIPANYHDILLKPEHNILIMGDKVGEFAGGLVNLRYQQMVPDEDNTPMDECWRAWEKALSSIYVLVPTRPDWLGTLTMLDLDRVKDKDFIKKHILELDLIGDISTDNLNELADKIRRQTGVDKFDFIIGNPPYQKTDGNSSKFRPIYPYFIDLSYSLSDKAVLVTPARFLFNAGATSKKWNEKMLNDLHLKVLKYFENSRVVFSNADVKGGIAVILRDASQDFGAIKAFIPNKELASIFKKVNINKSFSDLVNPLWHYKYSNLAPIKNKVIQANAFDKQNKLFEKKNKLDINILGRQDNLRTILSISLGNVKPEKDIALYKVFLPKAAGCGKYPDVIIGKAEIGLPNEICTGSFLVIGSFNSKKEAKNCRKYLETKFCRALVSIQKKTQNTTKDSFKFVPMQDFSDNSDINWNVDRLMLDQQFYNKYNLTLHESTWIEQNIKEIH